ncbi:MAG TPA: protein-disulfide reductase DsbD, partial [Gammaproteobacteria bacterium]|nr:protein-disulfide reductase DsbD [Gammaproteobacteria bacterium]
IAPGYYIYRKELAVSAKADSMVTLGELNLPTGRTLTDPYFGVSEVYDQDFTALVPLQAGAEPPARLDLEVRHQGCAEGGLCYPPQTTPLTVTLAGAATATVSAPIPTAIAGGVTAEQDRLATLLADSSLLSVLLVFFGAGLLLTFTPCVLPMLPILSSIIVGAGGNDTSRYRGLVLSSAYVLPMALAYAALGAAAGIAGANLQAYLQSPLVLWPFAGLFVLLALAMFGFFELRLPTGFQTKLAELSGRQRGGQLIGASVMGLLSALIVGPCMTAPLAGALLYIGQTGDAVLGGLALFALGLGMGLPLILVGTLGGQILPKAGAWMRQVQVMFGFVLLGVAIWMLERLLPAAVAVALWGLLLLGIALVLRPLEPIPAGTGPAVWLRKSVGVAIGLWSVLLLIGAAAGTASLFQPLAVLTERMEARPAETTAAGYEPIFGLPALQARLSEASAAGQAVVVDFYADWCVSCKVMEREVFGDPGVQRAMAGVLRLQPDVTANDAADRALLKQFEVIGPPTLLFFDADGLEQRSLRVVGEIDAKRFLARLQQAFGGQ